MVLKIIGLLMLSAHAGTDTSPSWCQCLGIECKGTLDFAEKLDESPATEFLPSDLAAYVESCRKTPLTKPTSKPLPWSIDLLMIPAAEVRSAELPSSGARLLADCAGKHLQLRADLGESAQKALLKRVFTNLMSLGSNPDKYSFVRGQALNVTGEARTYWAQIGGSNPPSPQDFARSFSRISATSFVTDVPVRYIDPRCYQPSKGFRKKSGLASTAAACVDPKIPASITPLTPEQTAEMKASMKLAKESQERRTVIDERLAGNSSDAEAIHLIRSETDQRCKQDQEMFDKARSRTDMQVGFGMAQALPPPPQNTDEDCSSPPPPNSAILKVAQLVSSNAQYQAKMAQLRAVSGPSMDDPQTKNLTIDFMQFSSALNCQTQQSMSDDQVRDLYQARKDAAAAMESWLGRCHPDLPMMKMMQ